MFRVQCFVEDKRLAVVLRALKGMAYNVEAVPVDETIKNGGTLANISLKGRKTINSAEMREILQGAGMSPASSSYALKQLQQAGRIKKLPKSKGNYEVL